MAAAAEAAAAALPSEGHGGVHFAIPEGTTTIKGPDALGRGEDSWKEWGVDKTKVTRVTIPSSVISIGEFAFRGCWALASLAIPSSATSIGNYAFYGCSSLASLAIPSSVARIENNAFYGCSSLARLEIPSSVARIGYRAFNRCSSLASLIVQPIDGTATANATETASDEGAAPNTLAIITAFNDVDQFAAVTQVWATDTIIAALKGLYTEYDTFAAIPRRLKAAPDATTWAGVQLWLWWLPPTSFAAGSDDTRTVCTSRTVTIWNTMASA
eukprot:gene7523-biopygen27943